MMINILLLIVLLIGIGFIIYARIEDKKHSENYQIFLPFLFGTVLTGISVLIIVFKIITKLV